MSKKHTQRKLDPIREWERKRVQLHDSWCKAMNDTHRLQMRLDELEALSGQAPRVLHTDPQRVSRIMGYTFFTDDDEFLVELAHMVKTTRSNLDLASATSQSFYSDLAHHCAHRR